MKIATALEPDYTVKGACGRLNVSRQTIYDLIEAGILQSYTVGRARRITAESLEHLRTGAHEAAA